MTSPGERLLSETHYERCELGPGAVGWVYEYWNAETIAKSGLGAGLEIGAQLDGEWFHDGATHGAMLCARGTIYRIDPAERYRLTFRSPSRRAAQVGFIIYPDELGLTPTGSELRFAGDSGVHDARFIAFCREFRASAPSPARDAEARRALVGFVERHCDLAPAEPLERVKREIDETLTGNPSVGYFAELANMHHETFARAFKRRFGLTPASYRLHARLNLAARLSWSRPDWSVVRIAEASGFFDMPYFHRAFRKQFECTPAVWARRSRAARSSI